MPELRRVVRFAATPGGGVNGFGGRPPATGLVRYYELEVVCRGEPEASTGYLIDIKRIDEAVRTCAAPLIIETCSRSPDAEPTSLVVDLLASLSRELDGLLSSIRWRLTPYYSVEATMTDSREITRRVCIRQRFEIAASHRLHVPSLSEDENRRLFGKCNSPNGHGHNYQFEPCISIPAGDDLPGVTIGAIEQLADEMIIQPFDHTHLNEDTVEFAADGGINPTVENIARVFFERLGPGAARLAPDARLESVTVWETDRTSATYPVSHPA